MKAASDVYAPLSGSITEVNERLKDDSAIVNRDAEGEGWLIKIQIENQDDSHLLDGSAYQNLISKK